MLDRPSKKHASLLLKAEEGSATLTAAQAFGALVSFEYLCVHIEPLIVSAGGADPQQMARKPRD